MLLRISQEKNVLSEAIWGAQLPPRVGCIEDASANGRGLQSPPKVPSRSTKKLIFAEALKSSITILGYSHFAFISPHGQIKIA